MHVQTERTIIPFSYNKSKIKQEEQKRNECNFSKVKTNIDAIRTITIPPRNEIKTRLPTTETNGTRLCKAIKFNNSCKTPEAIVKVHNNYFYTTIINTSDTEQTFKIYKPLMLEKLNNDNDQSIKLHNINTDPINNRILKENLKNINIDHLNIEESTKLQELCYDYRDIFYHPDIPLSFTNVTQHKIRTKNEIPIFTKTYRYPHVHRTEVQNQINKMLYDDIIEPSESPYNFPIWVVPKKADLSGKVKWRIVIDYRKLNENTIEDKFPLPRIETVLDNLGKAEYFSTLDLASGFHQIKINKADREKTAFSTEEGHFQFKRMPFGLKNAPAAFQRLINQAMIGLTPRQCMIYLDDIVIFSKSLQEHLIKLKNVFERCRTSNLKIQLDKSEFLKKSVNYLGHVISQDGVKPNPDKISAIKKFPPPKTKTEIKSFLGMLGYYRKFIKDFAKLTKFLTVCLKKDNKIIHDEKFLDQFDYLKTLLTNEPILAYPDFDQTFELTTDASKFALGAVLSQKSKPICYASRTLNETEQRYSTIERELLAIVWATKHFRPYLFGTKFLLYTDHRPLVWLKNLKEPNSKLTRWALKLEEYNFDIQYIPGKSNRVADALSRIQLNPISLNDLNENLEPRLNTPEPIFDNVSILPERADSPNLEDFMTIPTFIPPSDEISTPFETSDQIIENDTLSDTVHTQASSTPVMDISERPLQHFKNQIEFVTANIPKNIRTTTFDNNQHISVFVNQSNKRTKFNELLIEHCQPKTNYYCYFPSDQLCKEFSQYINKITNDNTAKFHRCMTQVTYITNPDDRLTQLQLYHEGKTNHRGIKETLEHLQRKYYWSSIQKDIKNYIDNCHACKTQKYNRNPLKQPLNLTPTNNRPFHSLHMDIFQINKQKYLTLIDPFSKFAQAYHLPSNNLIDVIDRLFYFIVSYPSPQLLIADNEFNKNPLKDFLRFHKIQLHATTPYHHSSNSPVERLHSTLIEQYRLFENKVPEHKKMQYCILAYNNTIHSNLKMTPNEIVFGHTENRNPFDLEFDQTFLTDYVNAHKTKMKNVYRNLSDIQQQTKINRNLRINNKNSNHKFKVGDLAYLKSDNRNKSKPRSTGPYKVQEVLEHDTYILINDKNQSNVKRHANELLPFSGALPSSCSPSLGGQLGVT